MKRKSKPRPRDEEPKISIIERKIPFFLISRHILRGNKWTLCLVIRLMAVAFINLVFINSLFNGIVESSDNQVINTTSGNITMQQSPGKEFIDNASSVLAQIRKTPRVVGASSRTVVPASLLYKNLQGTYQIYAVQPSLERLTTNIARKMIAGLSLIHISEPTRLGMISYAVFCLK